MHSAAYTVKSTTNTDYKNFNQLIKTVWSLINQQIFN